MNSISLAETLLKAVKNGQATDSYVKELCRLPEAQLQTDLANTEHRKAFWINLYNASTQILLEQYQPDFSDRLQRIRFFSQRKINLAGHLLSLNNLEHGMLRHSAIWWPAGSAGLQDPFCLELWSRQLSCYFILFRRQNQ